MNKHIEDLKTQVQCKRLDFGIEVASLAKEMSVNIKPEKFPSLRSRAVILHNTLERRAKRAMEKGGTKGFMEFRNANRNLIERASALIQWGAIMDVLSAYTPY